MRVLLIIVSIAFFKSFSFSQGGLLINAGQFRIQGGHVVIGGNGNWTNNGTVNCVAGSTVDFVGNARQNILGTNTTTFDNVTINNSHADGVWVGRAISINNVLLMTQGHFNLRDYIVTFNSTASLSNEAETRRVRATDGAGTEGAGTGTIRTTRNNPSGNVAGLGLDFTPSVALGNTLFIRGNQTLQGSGSFTGNYSIYRYYDIQPTVASNTTVNVFNYFHAELGTQAANEANLEMFQWVNAGGPSWWLAQPSVVNAGANTVASNTIVNILTTYRVTLGSITSPLPIELINFAGSCLNGAIELKWSTASEYDNDYFVIEKSIDNVNYFELIQVASQGNSNTLQQYSFTDNNPFNGTSYYRLHQFDINGMDSYSESISVNCEQKNIKEDILPIFPSSFNLEAVIQGVPGNPYQLMLTNVLGQVITNKTVILSDYQQTVSLFDAKLANGIYYISMQTENRIISKPLFLGNQ